MSKTIFIVDDFWGANYVTNILCENQYSFKRIEDPSDGVLEAFEKENTINGSDLEEWNSSIWQSSSC